MTTGDNSTEEMNRLFASAGEAFLQGELETAKQQYQRMLEHFPQAPILHYNLGLTLYEQGDFPGALERFQEAARLVPDDGDILYNLALCQKQMGNHDAALHIYDVLLELEPDSVDALYNRGNCLRSLHRWREAEEAYTKVLERDPEHLSATNNLAYVCHHQGKLAKAEENYRRVLAARPDHPTAAHMIAAIAGTAAESAPHAYVIEVFDSYAEHFDHSLVDKLEYRVPTLLRHCLADHWGKHRHFRRGLDLGCGTGLSGMAFHEMVDHFTGLDLSEKMLARAETKNIYQTLVCATIEEFLQEVETPYDFVVAADVFTYLGDLHGVFSLLAERVSKEGVFCFSTESMAGDSYGLLPTGRFAHSTSYLKSLARETGWCVERSWAKSLRREKDGWIEGELWLLVR